MPRRLTTPLFVLLLFAGVALALWRHQHTPPPLFPASEYRHTGPARNAPPLFERRFVTPEGLTPVVHSGTLALLGDGTLLAAWFGGSREGAADVAIFGARWDGTGWSAPQVLIDRSGAQKALGRRLRKLGNPVLFRAASGRLWLFFVTVSIGGWSTSAIAYVTSDDEGTHWSPARQLVSSPFLNLSTLVRTKPLQYRDGSLALPVYHELVGKFGELLRLEPDGRILSKSRVSSGRLAIQPSLVASGERELRAFSRRVGHAPHRVLTAASRDGGTSWGPQTATNLPNPDASVAASTTTAGEYLLVYNDAEQGRGRLNLALSPDGLEWRRVADLESGGTGDEYSYPFLLRADDGTYHLIYTWQRRRMVHLRFNDAWLGAQQVPGAGGAATPAPGTSGP